MPSGISAFSSINAGGLAAGQMVTADGDERKSAVVLYDTNTGQMTTLLSSKIGQNALPVAINTANEVVGFFFKRHYQNSFIYGAGRVTILRPPPVVSVVAVQFINNAGAVAGYANGPFIYRHGVYTSPALPADAVSGDVTITNFRNGNSIAGRYRANSGRYHGYTSIAGMVETYDFPGSPYTEIDAIGPSHTLFGTYEVGDPQRDTQAFTYRSGQYRVFQAPSAIRTQVVSVSPSGTVAGTYVDAANNNHLYLATCLKTQAPCTQ